LGEPREIPTDLYATIRKVEDSPKKKVEARSSGMLKKFLENDGKVLRFFCYWDERGATYGDIRRFVSIPLHGCALTGSVEAACIPSR
jgi:hypothetical protein